MQCTSISSALPSNRKSWVILKLCDQKNKMNEVMNTITMFLNFWFICWKTSTSCFWESANFHTCLVFSPLVVSWLEQLKIIYFLDWSKSIKHLNLVFLAVSYVMELKVSPFYILCPGYFYCQGLRALIRREKTWFIHPAWTFVTKIYLWLFKMDIFSQIWRICDVMYIKSSWVKFTELPYDCTLCFISGPYNSIFPFWFTKKSKICFS